MNQQEATHLLNIENKKILLLGNLNSPHIEKWANFYYLKGAQVCVFSFEREQNCIYNENINCIISEQVPNDLLALKHASSEVRKIIKHYKPDIIHAHYLTSYGIVASQTGYPYFVSVWGTDIYKLQNRSREIRQYSIYALNNAELICSTSFCMAEITRTYTNNRIEVIPFGVDTDFFKPIEEDNIGIAEKPKICITKWMDDEKYGQTILIEAMKLLKEDGIIIEAALTGEHTNDTQKIIDLAKQYNVFDQIIFTGSLPLTGIKEILQTCTLAAFPSRRDDDSFSVSTVEASAMGLPIIASAIGGLLETVQDGVTGLHFQVNNAEDMACKINELINDPKKMQTMSKAGRKMVLDKFDIKKNVDQMAFLYNIYG